MGKKDTRYPKPPIWGTHIRWMALCPVAWHLIASGSIPMTYSTPPIVEECGKKQHDELVKEVVKFFYKLMTRGSEDPAVLMIELSPEYRFNMEIASEWRKVIVKPDIVVALGVKQGIINLVIEVTTRSIIPVEWLISYGLGSYMSNMRPTIILLVTPLEVRAYPLTTYLLRRLDHLRTIPPDKSPEPWLCSNCDLRPVCPDLQA